MRIAYSHTTFSLKDREMPHHPPENAPSYVIGRRRYTISGGPESAYRSRPRMKRRGAISLEKNDSEAEYIRYLGTKNVSQQ